MSSRLLLWLLCLPFAAQAQLPDLIPYRKGDLWGYADSTGKIIIQPQWTSAGLFYNNGLAYAGYRYKTSYGDTESYQQVIDRKGHYPLPDLMLDSVLKVYGINGEGLEGMKPDLEFDANYIMVQYQESEYLYFSFDGKLILAALPGNMSGEEAHSPYDCAFRFNRQLLYKKGLLRSGYVFCDNRGKELDIGHYDDVEDYYGSGFEYYWLFRYHIEDSKDTFTINPDGPAAAMYNNRHVLFVDTSGKVLLKIKEKNYLRDITVMRHPLDKSAYHRYLHRVYIPQYPGLEILHAAPGDTTDTQAEIYKQTFCYKDKYGRVYYEP